MGGGTIQPAVVRTPMDIRLQKLSGGLRKRWKMGKGVSQRNRGNKEKNQNRKLNMSQEERKNQVNQKDPGDVSREHPYQILTMNVLALGEGGKGVSPGAMHGRSTKNSGHFWGSRKGLEG